MIPISLAIESHEYLMLAGIVLLTAILIVNLRRRQGRSGEQLTAHERVERSKQVGGTRNDLRNMMVELEELTRRFGAQLDAKSIRLEKLLDEADKKIAALQAAERGESPSPAPVATEANEDAAMELARRDAAEPPASNANDRLSADVCRLADEGLSAARIADRLSEPIGKIELILALRQSESA